MHSDMLTRRRRLRRLARATGRETTPAFTVRHAATARASFEPYAYEVLRDGEVIAHYWHDYRGGEHGIRFEDGTTVDAPIGSMTDFLHGGGSEPLTLSPAARAWLSGRRASRRQRRPGPS